MGYLSIKSLGNAKDLQHFQGIMENKERLKREYMSMKTQGRSVGVYQFMKEAHCNYYTALKLINEISEKESKMGAS